MSGMAPFEPLEIELAGKNLIQASAGTGKTYAITTLFVRLLLERNLAPGEILVVTFTEAATAELRDRVRQRVSDALQAVRDTHAGVPVKDAVLAQLAQRRRAHFEADLARLQEALQSIDEAPISTLHGFCQRVLHDNAFRTRMPFDAELVADLSELQDDLLYDFWRKALAAMSDGMARQLVMEGIDIAALRGLMKEVLRNPRRQVVPPAPADADAIETNLGEVLAELRQSLDGLAGAVEFVRGHCKKTDFGGGPKQEALLAQLVQCCAASDASQFALPKHAELLAVDALRSSRKNYRTSQAAEVPEFFAVFERVAALAAQRSASLKHSLLREVETQLPQRKLQARVLGFEDLLVRVADALREDEEGSAELAAALRKRYRAVLIDEVQDTDPVQFEIFHAAFDHAEHPLFLIGDPKQAIYSFRGADVFAYVAAAASAKRFELGVNYRSDPSVLKAVNTIFGQDDAFLVSGIEYQPVSARSEAQDGFCAGHLPGASQRAGLEVLFLDREGDGTGSVSKSRAQSVVVRATAADIARLIEEKATFVDREGEKHNVSAGHVAVLTRTNNQSFLVQEALRERGVQAVVVGDKSVFASAEAAAVEAVLGAVLDPMNRDRLRLALTTALVGLKGDDLAANEEQADFWSDWVEKFQRWHELWAKRGFMRMYRALLSECKTAMQLLREPGGERQLTNVLHLGELLHRASSEEQLGPQALLAWVAERRRQLGNAPEAEEIRLESDEAAVKVMTAHKAKGLEFPIVYCPFLWDGKNPAIGAHAPLRSHDAAGKLVIDIGSRGAERAANKDLHRWEGYAEELRVAYVALTRARHRTVLLWGGFTGLAQAPLASLLHPRSAPPQVGDLHDDTLGKRSDEALCEDLQLLLARAGSSIALRRESQDYEASLSPRLVQDGAALRAVQVERSVHTWQRTGSFSGLVQHDHAPVVDDDQARDHDQQQPVDSDDAITAPPPAPRTAIGLLDVPRGPRMGNLFHEVFEQIDFTQQSDETLVSVTREKLDSYGLAGQGDVALLQERIVRAVRDTLATPLHPFSFRLSDLPTAKRRAELEFRVPVGSPAGGLQRETLAQVFRDHPSIEPAGALLPDYAPRVERLGFRELHGFLVGYVDLVFEHEGRWYVVDYKTNHLGDHLEDYTGRSLRYAMRDAHYYLQYHLYTLALHRHLGHFVPGYEYERDFGGVLYLFIKGMHPQAEAGNGIYFEKPPLTRLNALSLALASGAPGRLSA